MSFSTLSEPMRLAALIPALDASTTLAQVVHGVAKQVSAVLVVDDGSVDDTFVIGQQAGAEVLRHPENRGKGAAIITGLQHLVARGFTHVVTIDADGQHLPEEIPVLVKVGQEHPAAIVIGSRRIESEVAPIRRFGNGFANLWVWIATGKWVADSQSGFRMYPVRPILDLGLTGTRFEWETEVLIRAVRSGIAIRTIPVRVYYPPPDQRISHYHAVQDTVRIIKVVVGSIFRVR